MVAGATIDHVHHSGSGCTRCRHRVYVSCPRGCETLLFLISRGGIEGEIGTFFYHYYYYFYRLHARGTARKHYGKHDQVAKNFPVRQRFVGYTPTKIGKGAAAIKK
jgi:hypothetical protein